MGDGFFDESTEQSRVKTVIVTKYFWAWSRIIVAQQRKHPQYGRRLAYVDLYAGPGRYKDGTPSTPLLVLERAVTDPALQTGLITLFNDANASYREALEGHIASLPGIESLRHPPEFLSVPVEQDVVAHLGGVLGMPRLSFVDPWGYKGLTLDLLNWAVGEWGCDCLFFFSYNSINRALTIREVAPHIEGLFGASGAAWLREHLAGLRPREREQTIMGRLRESLSERGVRYVLPFPFLSSTGSKTRHHLVLLTKNATAHAIMKDIMAGVSTRQTEGVASLEHNPADELQPALFDADEPLDQLAQELLHRFAGQTLAVLEVFSRHNYGTPYRLPNYRDALLALEAKGQVRCDRPASARPKRRGLPTMADDVRVTFPPKETPDG
jgi:three-Cys-motif partner protein